MKANPSYCPTCGADVSQCLCTPTAPVSGLKSDTPETDGKCLFWNLEVTLSIRADGSINGRVVEADFARKLERERNAAIQALQIHEGKKAPVQGYAAGIPWDMHLEAYSDYCKRYSPQPALIEGWCRGGFHTTELDMFIPGWRDEIKRRHDQARAALASLTSSDAA